MKSAARSGEQELIQRFFAPLAAGFEGAAGLEDDAALYRADEGMDVVMTTDTVVESVHFLPHDPPDLIARKALRVSVSDLAAKGGRPRFYLLSLALDGERDETWLERFAQGLRADQAEYGCHLAGGDTVATPGPLTVTITAFAEIPHGRIVRRGGAVDGDLVYVTGTIGDAGLGLAILTNQYRGAIGSDSRSFLVGRYRLPCPRVALAPTVLAHANAAIDISDGLVGDMALLCRASGLGASIRIADIPLSPPARESISHDPKWRENCLTCGDDYEIACTVSPDDAQDFEDDAARAGVAVSRIGHITAREDGAVFRHDSGSALVVDTPSYSHI
ncbi:MAG: thiamine-phosphate kinase [Hyphomicrobiales bacterium]